MEIARPGGRRASLVAVPDEVLAAVLEAHPARCQLRALAPRCRAVVDRHFTTRRFDPPARKAFSVDFEINHNMTKHLYCAKFGTDGHEQDGDVSGAVTFMDWIPAYYRSNPRSNRDIRHRLTDSDACALWRLLTKVRANRAADAGDAIAAAAAAAGRYHPSGGRVGREGFLTVTEGCCADASPEDCKREVVGMLSALETDLVLSVLDHRRNASAVPAPSVVTF